MLVRARRQFGSSVHTLITNQCAMDLFSSVTLMGTMAMLVTHGYHNNNHNNNNNNNNNNISFRIPTPRRTLAVRCCSLVSHITNLPYGADRHQTDACALTANVRAAAATTTTTTTTTPAAATCTTFSLRLCFSGYFPSIFSKFCKVSR